MARWVVIGALNDKRVAAFTSALYRSGHGVPRVVTWSEAIRSQEALAAIVHPGDVLRIESPGMSHTVWNELTLLGQGTRIRDQAEQWRPGRAWFAGLRHVLSAMGSAADALRLRTMHDPQELLVMIDKAQARERLAECGAPIPDGFIAPAEPAELRAELIRRRWIQVFVKPRWGSSGAGVLAFRRSACTDAAREIIHTTVDLQPTPAGIAWVTRKRLSTYRDTASIDTLLGDVMRDGAVVERWIPKATVNGGPVDVRLVMIAGSIGPRIARIGAGPITNLHLDGERLDVPALLASLPTGTWERMEAACARVAAAFPRSLMIGIDCLVTEAGQPFILEVNGWGDYLPGLLHQGRDTYGAEIDAMLAGWKPDVTAAISA